MGNRIRNKPVHRSQRFPGAQLALTLRLLCLIAAAGWMIGCVGDSGSSSLPASDGAVRTGSGDASVGIERTDPPDSSVGDGVGGSQAAGSLWDDNVPVECRPAELAGTVSATPCVEVVDCQTFTLRCNPGEPSIEAEFGADGRLLSLDAVPCESAAQPSPAEPVECAHYYVCGNLEFLVSRNEVTGGTDRWLILETTDPRNPGCMHLLGFAED